MLQALRNQVSTWVVRLFLLLLVLSFAVWGVGDMFLGSPGGSTVAEVDGEPVSVAEVNREYTNNLRELQQRLGTGIDREGPLGTQILNDTLAQQIGRKLIEVHASDLAVATDDETIANAIREVPAFQVAGQFSRANFEFALQNIGLDEASFVEQLRSDLTRERILQAIDRPIAVPNILAIELEKHRGEERSATLLELPYDSITVDTPETSELEAYLQENSDSYIAPEYREGAMLVLSPEIVAADIDIDSTEIEALYEQRKDQLGIPARRTVQQIVAADSETIEAARQEALAGTAFADLPAALPENDLSFTTFEDLARGDLPAALDETIWATAIDDVSVPVESDFGWHIFAIASETAATETPLADVRDELREELALDQALDLLPDLAAALDDEIAAGNSLEEAAAALDLEVIGLGPIDVTGADPDGNRVLPDAVLPEMLQSFFGAPADEVSLLEETPDGTTYVYRVDRIEAERAYELDEVLAQVEADWRREEQRSEALDQARSFRGQIGEVTTMEELQAGNPILTMRNIGPLDRNATTNAAALSPEAVDLIFATAEGAIAEEVVELPETVAIVRVDTIVVPDIAEANPDLEAELSSEFRLDLLAHYEQALRRQYPVSVNQSALAAIIQPQTP